MADNTDKRIQLREGIHLLVVSAAARRCVSPAALISMVMYDYLRTSGELDANPPVSVQSVPATPKPVASSDPFASLPDPKKLAERLNVDANFLDEEEPPLPPDVQTLHDEWDDED